MERYEEEAGRYVLYIDGVRALSTGEYDALRAADDPQTAQGWLLLEGRPALAMLNGALDGKVELHELHLAFTKSAAVRLADALMARLSRKCD